MRRVSLALSPACLLAALAAAGPASAASPGAGPAPVSVVVRAIEAEAFAPRIALRGRTEADRRVEVAAQTAGLVASPPIRRGALVAAGDPLCVLDPGERPAMLAEAQALLTQAQAEFDAAQTLARRGFTAETDALARGARLEAARAQVDRARIEIGRLTIAAPFDGALESDTAELGALLRAGDVCATLIDLDPVALVAFAPERDVDRIEIGAPATARLVTGREVAGAVRFVARSADPDTRTFRVEIEVPNPDLSIRDGMSADISVALAPIAGHRVPRSALTLDDAGRLGLRLVVDGAARFAPVATLGEEAGAIWVAGLPERAEVIVVGQEFVGEGMPVTVAEGAP